MVLSKYVSKPPESIRIDRLPHGKPVLPDHPMFHFSLSHTDDLTVVVVTTLGPLGVDVESIRPYANLIGAVTLSMTSREQAILSSLPESHRALWFLHGWTHKEAILKATGTGIDEQLLKLEVSLDPATPHLVEWENHAIKNWILQSFTPTDRYIGAIAIEDSTRDAITINQRQLH